MVFTEMSCRPFLSISCNICAIILTTKDLVVSLMLDFLVRQKYVLLQNNNKFNSYSIYLEVFLLLLQYNFTLILTFKKNRTNTKENTFVLYNLLVHSFFD